MSAIFKDRKVPRHLIIREDYEMRQKPRMRMGRFIFWFLVVVATSYIVTTVPAGFWTSF